MNTETLPIQLPQSNELSYEAQMEWQNSDLPYDEWIRIQYHQYILWQQNQTNTVNVQNDSIGGLWRGLVVLGWFWFIMACGGWVFVLAGLIIWLVYKAILLVCKLIAIPIKALAHIPRDKING